MSKPFSQSAMIIGEFPVAIKKQIISTLTD